MISGAAAHRSAPELPDQPEQPLFTVCAGTARLAARHEGLTREAALSNGFQH